MTKTVYFGGRRSGKTTMMVLWYRANPGAKIVVPSHQRRRFLHLEYDIPREDILLYEDVERHGWSGVRGPVGFEDLDFYLWKAWSRLVSGLRQDQAGPASFDTDVLTAMFDTLAPLDPAVMEYNNAKLREEIQFEREKSALQKQPRPTRTFASSTAKFSSDYRAARARQRRRVRIQFGAIITVFVLAVVGIVGFGIFKSLDRHPLTCTVTDKDHTIAASSSGSTPVYRIYTRDCDVLEVSDNLWLGVFNSASTYGRIQPGHTYKFETVGWRVPIISSFPDIVSAVEVK